MFLGGRLPLGAANLELEEFVGLCGVCGGGRLLESVEALLRLAERLRRLLRPERGPITRKEGKLAGQLEPT